MFACEFHNIFRNSFFEEHIWAVATEFLNPLAEVSWGFQGLHKLSIGIS